MNTERPQTGRGFVQIELIAIIVVVAAALAVLAVASDAAQRRARFAGSVSNLQKYWAGISAFAADNENRVVSFSWRAGEQHEDPDGLVYPIAASDQDAAAHEAVSIMRRLANRPDIQPISAWIPHILYTHLPLVEYLNEPLPAEFTVSPTDKVRIAWQRATRNQPASDQGQAFFRLTARPPGTGNTEKRWPFSSSYEFGPAFFSPDAQVLTPEGWVETVSQGQQHNIYMTGANTPMGRRRLDEVRHPSQKAMVYETHAGDMGSGRSFFAFPQTRAPVLFADGSASVRSMSDANAGFNPINPRSLTPSQFSYSPVQSWEPPTLSGASQQLVFGRVRWTRSGLRGRDFGGPEVPWEE
jgi:hypothetical protein